jgi:hypothetical protein
MKWKPIAANPRLPIMPSMITAVGLEKKGVRRRWVIVENKRKAKANC